MAWKVFRSKTAVLPLPEDASALSIDGDSATGLDAPGWFLWSGYDSGVHELLLAVGSGDLEAEVEFRPVGGIMVLFR